MEYMITRPPVSLLMGIFLQVSGIQQVIHRIDQPDGQTEDGRSDRGTIAFQDKPGEGIAAIYTRQDIQAKYPYSLPHPPKNGAPGFHQDKGGFWEAAVPWTTSIRW
jgi:hypothetical protein